MVVGNLIIMLFIALAATSISITVTKAKVFKPFRAWLEIKNKWLHGLFSCNYCFSHWVIFILTAIYKPIVITSGMIILDLILSAFIIITICSLISGLTLRALFAPLDEE